ncbi:MAG: ABC transporter ATP-binding protein [Bacillota bacterium]|nr:ABC transporter ATP-binding protein [Bacillota bacterium]
MKLAVRMLREARKYWWWLIVSIIAVFIGTAAQLYAPQVVRKLTSLVEHQDPELAKKALSLAIMLTAVYLLQSICQGIRSYYTHFAAWHFVSDMRTKIYGHFQRLSLKYYQDKQTGQLMSRVTSDTTGLEVLIAHAVPDLIVNIIIFAGVAIMLFSINVKLALLTLVSIPFLAVTSGWFVKKVRPQFRKGQKAMGELNAILQDNLSGIKEIQVFNQQNREYENVEEASLLHAETQVHALKLSAIYHPTIQFLSNMGTVFVIGYGGYLASKGGIPLSDIITVILYLSIFYQPISTLARIMEDLQNAGAGAERIFEVLDTEPDVKEKKGAKPLKNPAGHIEYRGVTFGYNETPVLKDVSLEIKPGQMVALVGQTGVGKTTMISLLNRFYDPQSGEILIDGKDVRDLTLSSLRDSISVVLQDVFLFHGSVADNIAYGKPGATMDEIIAAAKVANAHEFIEGLENGYDTFIGERGVKLSGGQKQRLSIARAVLRDKPILVLDEATASVDVYTERLIQEAMDTVMNGRTTIVIAHRLSTIRKADKIIVMDSGAIAECGTHDELMALGGVYAGMNHLQEQ